MAEGYSVGNLSIAFNALDKTGDDFKMLATNLRAIVNLINKISTADLGKFSANIKRITSDFSPFLKQISKAETGLQAFNNVAKQIGVRNMSGVVADLEEIQQVTSDTAKAQQEYNVTVQNGTANARIINETVKAVENLNTALSGFDTAKAQVTKLSSELLNLHFETGDFDKGKVSEMLALTEQIKSTTEAFKRLQMTEEENTIADYQQINATRKQRIAYLEATLAMGTAGNQAKAYKKELAELRKEDGQVGKKSGLSKFLGQVKRIAIYRLIRTGLKEITSAAKEGTGAYAQFDSSINQTMSHLKTSTTIIKTSFGATLIPILQAITPIIQQISVGFANMANVINASMSKTGKYTKINTDRLLAYNKAANLFDFDKFRALNKGDEATGLFSTENVEDLNDELGVTAVNYKLIYDVIKNISAILANMFSIVTKIFDAASPIIMVVLGIADGLLYVVHGITWLLDKSGLLSPILYAILGYFIALGVTNFVTWLKTGALATWFKNAAAGASTFGGKLLGLLGTTQALAVGIGALAGGLIYFIQNLDKMGTTAKILIPIFAALAAVITGVAVARSAAAAGIAAPVQAGITAAALAAAITFATGTAIAVGKYANGGMPDKGSMFVAGEAGAEFVYNMPSGQSGVANIQQIAQAEYQGTMAALNDWWKSARNDIGGDVYLDGEVIYRNTTSHAKKHGQKWNNV